MNENVIEIKLAAPASPVGPGSGATAPQGGTRPGGSVQAPPPPPPPPPPKNAVPPPPPNPPKNPFANGSVGLDQLVLEAQKEARQARDHARKVEREAEDARRRAVASGSDEDREVHSSAVERARQARFDAGEKYDSYRDVSEAHGVVSDQIGERARAQQQAERDAAEAAKKVASDAKKAAKEAAATKAKSEADAAAAIQKRQLMQITLGQAGEQAARGGALNMVGAATQVAGSGALGETAAAFAGGPELAAAVIALQVAKAGIDAAVDRAQSVKQYSAKIQEANAVAGARDTIANIREAQRNEGSYSTLIDSKSRIENVARSLTDPYRDAIIEHVSSYLEQLAEFLEDAKPLLQIFANAGGAVIKIWSFVALLPLKIVVKVFHLLAQILPDYEKDKDPGSLLFAGIDAAIDAFRGRPGLRDDVWVPAPAMVYPMGFPRP